MPSNPMQDCPNCGSRTADTKLYRFGYCVHCSVCGFNGPTKDSAADAMDEWNNLPAYDGSDALDTWMELRRKATTPAPADSASSSVSEDEQEDWNKLCPHGYAHWTRCSYCHAAARSAEDE